MPVHKAQVVLLSALIALILSACSPSFTAADIEKMKESIKAEFEKSGGATVIEVVMLKESSTKATGFVKLRIHSVGDVTKPCNATMAEGGRYIWNCG